MKLEDLPSLTELAKVEFTFDRYQDGKLWYYVLLDPRPRFWAPVPIEDAGGAFYLRMKGIELLRWIRPQLAMMIGELKLQETK